MACAFLSRILSRITAISMLPAAIFFLPDAPAQIAPQPQTDVTFVFTADTHVSFNGINDVSGILSDGANPLLAVNENMANAYGTLAHNGCIVPNLFWGTKDLCNQVQLVGKINALPSNNWIGTPFEEGGHTRMLTVGGPIAPPEAVLIGGDLTDCGGGVEDSCGGEPYGNVTNGAQLNAFEALFDRSANASLALNGMPFLPMPIIPGYPLNFPMYPGLGNHDLQHPGSYMTDYLRSFILNHAGSLTNIDPIHLSYSFNLGNVHVICANVYPGSDIDGNMSFSQDSMNWFKADLAKFASDGRPVIIFAHFGFDSFSLKSGWWTDTTFNRVEGLNQLWGAMKNYDIIGYFQGHEHAPDPWYTYPFDYSLRYDVFRPGAGYRQDFDVVHLTNTSMDVMTTPDEADFADGQTDVALSPTFTKQLVPAPTTVTALAPAPPNAAVVSSVQVNGITYLLTIGGGGEYTLSVVSPAGSISPVDANSVPGLPQAATGYTLNHQAHFAMLMNGTLADYVIGSNNRMTADWTQPGVSGDAAILFEPEGDSGVRYLAVDNSMDASVMDIYQINASSASLEASLPARAIAAPVLMPYSFGPGGFGLLRMQPSIGAVEYDVLTLSPTNFSLTNYGEEYWPKSFQAVSAPMANGSTQIFIASAPCSQYDGAGVCVTLSNDSPFYIRTVLPDNSGTDISWRGLPATMPLVAPSTMVPLGTMNGLPAVGLYFRTGLFYEVVLTPGAPRH